MLVSALADKTARSIAAADIDSCHAYVQIAAQALCQLGYLTAIFKAGQGETPDGLATLWEIGMGRRVSAFLRPVGALVSDKATALGALQRGTYEHEPQFEEPQIIVFTGGIAGVFQAG